MRTFFFLLLCAGCDLALPSVVATADASSPDANGPTPSLDASASKDATPPGPYVAPNEKLCQTQPASSAAFCDDFEQSTLPGRWAKQQQNGGKLEVVDRRLNARSQGGSTFVSAKSFSARDSQRIEADIRIDSMPAANFIYVLALEFPTYGALVTGYISARNGDTGIRYSVVVGNTVGLANNPIAIGEWHHLVLEANVATRKMTFELDGVKGIALDAPTLAKGNLVPSAGVMGLENANAEVTIDNVVVTISD